MLTYTLSALLLALSANAIKIDSPAINQCKPVTFSITESTGDVHLAVVPIVNPCSSDALAELGPLNLVDNKFTWDSATIPAGTHVYVIADDASGEIWSNEIVVGGSASDCPSSSSANAANPTTPAGSSHTSSHSSQTSAPVNAANSPEDASAAPKTAFASVAMTLAFGLLTATTLF